MKDRKTKPAPPPSVIDLGKQVALRRLRRAFAADPTGDPMIEVGRMIVNTPYPPVGSFVTALADRLFRSPTSPSRKGLAPRNRERCLIALFVEQDTTGFYLPIHIYWGLMLGLTVEDVAEVIALAGVYTGLQKYTAAMDKLSATLTDLKGLVAGSTNSAGLDARAVSGFLRDRFSLAGVRALENEFNVMNQLVKESLRPPGTTNGKKVLIPAPPRTPGRIIAASDKHPR